MTGTSATTFGPDESTTRAMIVTILYRLADKPETTEENMFTDVNADQYYADAVVWGAANGIVKGNGDGTFEPEGNVTREQLAAFLYRYAQMSGYDVSVGEDTNILSYNDAMEISEYAIPAMQWACGAGLIQGSDGDLMPGGSATRSEVATILYRFCEKVAK